MSPSPHSTEALDWRSFPKVLNRRDADRPDVSPGMLNHRSASNAQRRRPANPHRRPVPFFVATACAAPEATVKLPSFPSCVRPVVWAAIRLTKSSAAQKHSRWITPAHACDLGSEASGVTSRVMPRGIAGRRLEPSGPWQRCIERPVRLTCTVRAFSRRLQRPAQTGRVRSVPRRIVQSRLRKASVARGTGV